MRETDRFEVGQYLTSEDKKWANDFDQKAENAFKKQEEEESEITTHLDEIDEETKLDITEEPDVEGLVEDLIKKFHTSDADKKAAILIGIEESLKIPTDELLDMGYTQERIDAHRIFFDKYRKGEL